MKLKLEDVFELQMGKTPSRNDASLWGGGIPWCSISDLSKSSKYLLDTKETLTCKGVERSGIKVVPVNTVIMSFKLSIGKAAITKNELYTNEAIIAFIDKGKYDVDINYMYHYCKGHNWSNGVNKAVMGLTLNKATIKKNIIDLPCIEDQRLIAEKLDKIDSLIETNENILKKLDLLIKSRFIEMFGNPLINTKLGNCLPLYQVCKDIYGGGTPSKKHTEFYSGNIPWVTSKDMKSTIITDSIDHITEAAISHSTAKLIPSKSVVMVVRSGILKHTLPVAMNIVPITINQDLKALIPGDMILPEYLLWYFKLIEKDVLSGVRAVTADNIDFKSFIQRQIPIPPLDKQRRYAEVFHNIDKSKFFCMIKYFSYT